MAKKKQVQTDDGWTVVAGSATTPSNNDKNGNAEASNRAQQEARPRKTVNGLTVDKLAHEFRGMQKRFNDTLCAKNLERMLRLRDGLWTLDNAVCIGVGSFSIDWEHRYRSLWQFVLFLNVVEIDPSPDDGNLFSLYLLTICEVMGKQNNHISLYAQDPAFTPLDTEFLSSLNITPLTSTAATHISSSSFVFAPFVDWFLLLPHFLKDKDPHLYVGNEVLRDYAAFANTRGKKDVLTECNRLGKGFLEGREKRKVPGFDLHGGALEGLVVYWKEEGDSDEEG
ncbi:unnamed protein product [Periconia digitata]|uniref:SRR1-like domain-containing protein n=1 Tax=Periconia digitata TaxID=1303443 RepID=A0A9W4UTD7_9PLEO|nr:unnamed protein product [Periconia digitata]